MKLNRWYRSGKELLDEISLTNLPESMLAVWYLGQASMVVKSGSTVYYIDPYLSDCFDAEGNSERSFAPPFQPEEILQADYVICTHNHSDHLDPATLKGIAKASPEAKFIVPYPETYMLKEAGIDDSRIIGAKALQKIETEGGVITPIRAAHEELYTDDDGNYTCLGYMFACEAGTLYHSGDTVEWETMVDELKEFAPDIVCLPINGADHKRRKTGIIGNLNAREAADVADDCGADLFIPIHFDLFVSNGENPAQLADYMNRFHAGKKYHFMALGERLIYMK